MWDDGESKWRVLSGNAYATGSLPSGGTYVIDTGMIAIDTTTDEIKRYTGAAWETIATSLERGGDNEINGDHLDIDLTPSNYTPSTTPAEADNADDLAAHLAGIDDAIAAATDSATGVVELATTSEINTGTDAGRAVTPDAFAGSNHGIRYLEAKVFDWTTDTATGDGKYYWHVPPALNGMNLVYTHAEVITAGITGTLDIQIHNLTQAADMLTTKITIDTTETGSDTAATPAVIDAANDDVATNDVLRVDIDAIHSGTAAKGLIVTLGFQLP